MNAQMELWKIIKDIMASQKFGYYTTHHYPKLLQLYYLSMTCPIKGLSLMRTSTLDDCLIVSNSCLRITIDYDLGPEKSIEFWFYWAAKNLKEREQEGELAYSGGDLHKLNEIQKLLVLLWKNA